MQPYYKEENIFSKLGAAIERGALYLVKVAGGVVLFFSLIPAILITIPDRFELEKGEAKAYRDVEGQKPRYLYDMKFDAPMTTQRDVDAQVDFFKSASYGLTAASSALLLGVALYSHRRKKEEQVPAP